MSGSGARTGSQVSQRCVITDPRAAEISGATSIGADNLLVVNDKRLELLRVDAQCRVSSWWQAPAPAPGTKPPVVDVEDLATAPDGTVWLLDGGGNRIVRREIHLVGIPRQEVRAGAVAVTPSRVDLVLPRSRMDIEGFVLTRDFRVVMVTKVARGPAEVFTAQLNPVAGAGPAPVQRVGALDLRSVPGKPAKAQTAVTGLALSPDGTQVALRTPTEVFSLDVADRRVADAMVKGAWRWVTSAAQKQGEAIAFSPSGANLMLLTEQLPAPVLSLPMARPPLPGRATARIDPGALDWTWPVAATGLGVLGGALALFLIRTKAGTRRRIAGPLLVGAGVFALGTGVVAVGSHHVAPDYAGTAVVSFVPRNPVSTGSDTLQMLQSRYVAALTDPALLASARELAKLGADSDALTKVDALVDPGTVNLSITVNSVKPASAAALANALAVLVQADAAEDPLVYARQSAAAVPPRTPSVPTVQQLAGVGNLGSLIAALAGGVVVARRLRPADLGGTTHPSATPTQENP